MYVLRFFLFSGIKIQSQYYYKHINKLLKSVEKPLKQILKN
jgi:hypothetical protein